MEKNIYLGRNSTTGFTCLLYSFLTFQEIQKNVSKLKSSDFIHDSTDWNGCDTEDQTLKSKHLKRTKYFVLLPSPLTYYGADSDMGHSYAWRFDVDEIIKVIEQEESEVKSKDCTENNKIIK